MATAHFLRWARTLQALLSPHEDEAEKPCKAELASLMTHKLASDGTDQGHQDRPRPSEELQTMPASYCIMWFKKIQPPPPAPRPGSGQMNPEAQTA